MSLAPGPRPLSRLRRPIGGRGVTYFGLVVVCFGLLLWARLILVTGHPRTATAEPGAAGTAPADVRPPRPDHRRHPAPDEPTPTPGGGATDPR